VYLVSRSNNGATTADVRTPVLPPVPEKVARAAPPAAAQIPAPPAAAPSSDAHPEAQNSAPSSPPLRPASTQPEAAGAAQPATPASGTVAQAQPDVSSKPVIGGKYKVLKGDMLTDIALQVYGDAHKFRLIQQANPSIRNKPNRILADQVIFIPPDKP
jgi:nucleoid-associated protein YgaU